MSRKKKTNSRNPQAAVVEDVSAEDSLSNWYAEQWDYVSNVAREELDKYYGRA